MNCVAAATIDVRLVALTAGPVSAAEIFATEIVAQNVAARGGLDAWRKVETMVWIGHIESAQAPLPSMRFKLEQKRPNRTRLQINALGVRVFDGVQGWIDYAAKGNSVTLEGVDEIGGRKAYHLNVRLAKGGNEEVWVDTMTYLDIRYDRMADGPAGALRRVSATYDDYRTVEGLQIPFLIETGGGPGITPDKMQIETVVLNVPLDDSTFGNPAAPHPRNRVRRERRASTSSSRADRAFDRTERE